MKYAENIMKKKKKQKYIILQHEIARAHSVEQIKKKNIKRASSYTAYLPDLASTDFYLFRS